MLRVRSSGRIQSDPVPGHMGNIMLRYADMLSIIWQYMKRAQSDLVEEVVTDAIVTYHGFMKILFLLSPADNDMANTYQTWAFVAFYSF